MDGAQARYQGSRKAGPCFGLASPVFSVGGGQLPARAQPMQPFEVVGQADQGPFQGHLLPPAQPDPSGSEG